MGGSPDPSKKKAADLSNSGVQNGEQWGDQAEGGETDTGLITDNDKTYHAYPDNHQ